MTVGIIEAGYGNIPSLKRVLKQINCEAVIVREPEDLESLDKLIIPGVGSFPRAMHFLNQSGLKSSIISFVQKNSNSVLGICLGAQLLFESSSEEYQTKGLGLIQGHVTRLNPKVFPYRVPHTGWSETIFTRKCHGFKSAQIVPFYYNHSYFFSCSEDLITTRLNIDGCIPTGISDRNIHAFQFHPEKSLDQGRLLLQSFVTGNYD